jgi:hypothetical protein
MLSDMRTPPVQEPPVESVPPNRKPEDVFEIFSHDAS